MGNFARSNNNAGGVQTINFCGDAAGHNYQVFSVDSSSGPDDMEAVLNTGGLKLFGDP